MDAEKVAPLASEYEFMVEKTLKKLARTAKFHITPLGSLIATMYRPRKSSKGLKGTPGAPVIDRLRNEVSGSQELHILY